MGDQIHKNLLCNFLVMNNLNKVSWEGVRNVYLKLFQKENWFARSKKLPLRSSIKQAKFSLSFFVGL